MAVSAATQHACFVIPLREGATTAYMERHSPVSPEMLEALDRSGWRKYSIFMHPDGFVVGVFEADDVGAAVRAMEAEEVNARWQADSADLFAGDLVWLPIVFNLEEQLRTLHAQSGDQPSPT